MRIDGRVALAVAGSAALLAAATAQAAGLQWVPNASRAATANIIVGGQEPGRQLPICRGEYNKGVHPGKVVAGKCNIGWGGKEILLTRFDVLTGPAKAVQWVKTASGAKLSPTAFIGGQEPGRLLPICRGAYNKGVHPGKIVAGKCSFGWGGKEIVLTSYETMTVAASALAPLGVELASVGGLASDAPGSVGAMPAKGHPSSAEVLALLAALQAEQGAGKLAAVKQQAVKLHKKNEQMKWAAEVLKALKTGKPVSGKTPAGHDIKKAAEAAGVKLTGKADADKKAVEALLGKLKKESESDLAKMQSALDKRNQQFELLSNIMKKFAETQQAIIRNMR